MYKKNRKKSSSSRKLLVSMGLVAAALAAVVGIILGINQFLSNGVEATLANLGIADSITANQKVLESIPIEFEVPNSYRSSTLKEVATSEKVVALTFDDGPWPQTTEAILDTLKKEDVKATFFVIGQPLRSFPEIAKKVVADGHEIANHTVHHWYHKMSPLVAQREIDDTNKIILETLNVKTNYFRPPGGVLTNGLVDYAHKLDDAVLMWSADSGDSQPRRPSPETIVKNVISQTKPGGIILMHDGGGKHENTAKALPTIIKKLRAEGYRFTTITGLLETTSAAVPPMVPGTTPTASPSPAA
jgi:peptidoglycan-N-acetylglucosamine deacetylase